MEVEATTYFMLVTFTVSQLVRGSLKEYLSLKMNDMSEICPVHQFPMGYPYPSETLQLTSSLHRM